MSLKTVLALSVLLCFSTYYTIEGEVIRGVKIPTLNITGILGKWYLVATTEEEQKLVCMNIIIKQQSKNNFTMDIESTEMFGLKRRFSARRFKPDLRVQMNAIKKNGSNIINLVQRPGFELGLVIFDLEYDSYMVWYLTNIRMSLEHATRGIIFILSRETTLSDDIFCKAKSSNFYARGVDPANKLFRIDTSVC
ncbi:hypothetical protein PV326_012789 [Microctonus aethiopoides]|uniref:Lipocalin/cytosolic fatty-acid binding domain-containing protein n=1 Tax=Microctonus aethiopoides TaxID=144406 RepID=A0AA39FNW3_9HYME|nr:hypothetical protein PV326_012789 [Microctonus aethiopoides]KAK0172820.1 hypothetical protein PV328_006091 [Microctonus aethiopoides]